MSGLGGLRRSYQRSSPLHDPAPLVVGDSLTPKEVPALIHAIDTGLSGEIEPTALVLGCQLTKPETLNPKP